MPITHRTIIEATCDHCKEHLDTNAMYVDAGVYGAAFHPVCWRKMGGPEVAKALSLDDVEYTNNATGDRERAWS